MICDGNWRCALLPLLAAGALASCSTAGFYRQALAGQMEMSRKARPVAEVLADPASKPLLREKLTTARDILAFAEAELGLPAKGQYERYASLGRRYSVWVVFAAPEFSVEPKRWWYPLIGSLKYRGYFQEAPALREAERCRAQGLETFVGGVEAYSTLGWLRDPLLNTFIGRDDGDLAELLFHELTHQRLYLPGDTDFNEALATAVGQEGARRWLKARGRPDDLRAYEKELRVERQFIAELLRARDELKTLYARADMEENAMRQSKQAVFDQLRIRVRALDQRHGGSLKLEKFFSKPVNNARLATVATYHDLLPDFEALLRRCGGDLERFFQHIRALRRLTPAGRANRLRAP
ncbi:MAG TPA: aminopeptidase [Verrucomicrobiales bacterium]|nr:aminopeptidase [Verrucomicrobiales bacterium]